MTLSEHRQTCKTLAALATTQPSIQIHGYGSPYGGDVEPPPSGSSETQIHNENERDFDMEEPISTAKQTDPAEQGKQKSPQDTEARPQTQQRDNLTLNSEIPKATSATCKPIVVERSKIELPGHRINAQIQFMKDHVLIGKFIGFLPTEKSLQGWVAAKWKPKGHVTLQLRPKGLFTTVFNCKYDRNRILDGGSYFFNFAGLYLRDWIERFNLDREDFNWAPVWIHLYSLPLEY